MSYLRVEFHVFHPSPSPESGKGFLAAGFLLRRNRAIRLLPVRDFCTGAYRRDFIYNLVWQSVICRPGKLLIPCKKESDAAPNHSDRQTASPPWGKRAAGGSLTTVGLR